MGQVTGGAVGAAVHLVSTAGSLGQGAAAPGAVKHSAARGGVGAMELAVGAQDVIRGLGIWSSEAGPPISTAVEALRAAVEAIPA